MNASKIQMFFSRIESDRQIACLVCYRKEYMESSNIKIFYWVSFVLLSVFLMSKAAAEETIIQQEKISFEKCLKVITTSQDKLSIAPEVKNLSDQKRVAVFSLVDGTLTILCDGVAGNVTVSTSTN